MQPIALIPGKSLVKELVWENSLKGPNILFARTNRATGKGLVEKYFIFKNGSHVVASLPFLEKTEAFFNIEEAKKWCQMDWANRSKHLEEVNA